MTKKKKKYQESDHYQTFKIDLLKVITPCFDCTYVLLCSQSIEKYTQA